MKQYQNISVEVIFLPMQDVLTDSTSNDNVTDVPDFD